MGGSLVKIYLKSVHPDVNAHINKKVEKIYVLT